VQDLHRLDILLDSYGIKEFVSFDASVVRGLAYYTGLVFEGFDRRGAHRAICGGGRYDKLMTLYGAKRDIPCVGFGLGDCVIMDILSDQNLLPDASSEIAFVVAAYDKTMLPNAIKTASILRAAGVAVDLCLEAKQKVGKAFDYANRVGAEFMVFVAPDEWERGCVCFKSLRAVFSQELLQQIQRLSGQGAGTLATEDSKQVEVSIDHLGPVSQALACSGAQREPAT